MMRVLLTGHDGYIGAVMAPMLEAAGYDVVGLDTGLFAECAYGNVPAIESARKDIRDVTPSDLEGFDAVIHLAALSNDPMGDLNPELTYDINYRASVRLAEAAKAAGVERFLFSSSCSLYGAGGDARLDETAAFNPVTPYGHAKVLAEADLTALADDDFSPVYLRNATAYGLSPRLRADLVVNNLTGLAFTTGEVRMNSDGTPWRPLVHVEDICRAFLAVLDAPREVVHDQAFNVGRTEENYQIRTVAAIVEDVVAGSRVTLASGAGPDARNYQVDFSKITDALPAFKPTWTVRDAVVQLADAFAARGLDVEEFNGRRFVRLEQIKHLLGEGRLDADLRWRAPARA
jgi:nucleoside-diphosphate-sugar epimerase